MSLSYQFPPSSSASNADASPDSSPLTRLLTTTTTAGASPLTSPSTPPRSTNSRKRPRRPSLLLGKINTSSHNNNRKVSISSSVLSPSSDVIELDRLEKSKEYVKSLLSGIDGNRREDSIRALRSIKKNLPQLKLSIENIQAESAAALATMSPTPDAALFTSNLQSYEGKVTNLTNYVKLGLDQLRQLRAEMEMKIRKEASLSRDLKSTLSGYTEQLQKTIAEVTEKVNLLTDEKLNLQKKLKDSQDHVLRLDSLLLKTLKHEEMTTRKYRNKMNDTAVEQERLERRLLDLFDFSDTITKEQFLDCLDDNKEIRDIVVSRREKVEARQSKGITSSESMEDIHAVSAAEYNSAFLKTRADILSTVVEYEEEEDDVGDTIEAYALPLNDEELELLIQEQHETRLGSDEVVETSDEETDVYTTRHRSHNGSNLGNATISAAAAAGNTHQQSSASQSPDSGNSPSFNAHVDKVKQQLNTPLKKLTRRRSNSLPVAAGRSVWQNQMTGSTGEALNNQQKPLDQQKSIFKRFLKVKEEFSEIDQDIARVYAKLGLSDQDVLPENEEAVDTSDLISTCEMEIQTGESFGSSPQIMSQHRSQSSASISMNQKAHTNSLTTSTSSYQEQRPMSNYLEQAHREVQVDQKLTIQQIAEAVNSNQMLYHELRQFIIRQQNGISSSNRGPEQQSIRGMMRQSMNGKTKLPKIRRKSGSVDIPLSYATRTYNSNNAADTPLHSSTTNLGYGGEAGLLPVARPRRSCSPVKSHGNEPHESSPLSKSGSHNPLSKFDMLEHRLQLARQAYHNSDALWRLGHSPNQHSNAAAKKSMELINQVARSTSNLRRFSNKAKPMGESVSLQGRLMEVVHDRDNSYVSAKELLSLRTSLPQSNISR